MAERQIEHRKLGFVIGLTQYHSSFPNLKQEVSLVIYDPVVRTINKLRRTKTADEFLTPEYSLT